jgi:hypothetical protein
MARLAEAIAGYDNRGASLQVTSLRAKHAGHVNSWHQREPTSDTRMTFAGQSVFVVEPRCLNCDTA